MNDISIYFQAVNDTETWQGQQLGIYINKHLTDFPELEKNSCALFYVPEFRGNGAENKSSASTFRQAFYSLHHEQDWKSPIYDLGDILPGKTLEDIENNFRPLTYWESVILVILTNTLF